MACSPNLVASTRSNAVGLPPRWTCPSTVVRASFPVRWAISDSNRFPIPERRTWPNGSTSPSRGGNVPSRGTAPSATTIIGA